MTDPADEPKHPRRWPWGLGLGIAGLLLGGGLTFGVIEAATPNYNLASSGWQHAWDVVSPGAGGFLTSPGPAGLAALAAAGLAYRSVTRQIERDRKRGQQEREAEVADRAEDRWWEMYRMVEKTAATLSDQDRERALEALESSMTGGSGLQDAFFIALSYRLEMGDPVPDATEDEEGGE